MRTRASIITGAIALAICLVCPLVDLFDQWDHALQTGNDSEYPLVILALCVGIAFALGQLIVTLSQNLQTSSIKYVFQSALNSLAFLIRPTALAIPSSSPPLSLRI
jgi:predicted subunit of tRNA(5-methylaminomethyl-2-thiouridylate) methyltransferase